MIKRFGFWDTAARFQANPYTYIAVCKYVCLKKTPFVKTYQICRNAKWGVAGFTLQGVLKPYSTTLERKTDRTESCKLNHGYEPCSIPKDAHERVGGPRICPRCVYHIPSGEVQKNEFLSTIRGMWDDPPLVSPFVCWLKAWNDQFYMLKIHEFPMKFTWNPIFVASKMKFPWNSHEIPMKSISFQNWNRGKKKIAMASANWNVACW